MLWTHRQAPKVALCEKLADRPLVKAYLELALDPCLQIATPPPHDAVARQVRPVLNPADQFGFLFGRQARLRSRRTTIREPGKPVDIVSMHPITQGLPVHTAHLSRVPARVPFQDPRKGQHASCGVRIPTPGRLSPKIDR